MASYHNQKPPRGVKVSPQSKAGIQKLASGFRSKILGVTPNCLLDLAYHLEFTLPQLGLEWSVVENHIMSDVEAATNPDSLTILIREDIYNALHDPLSSLHSRARFTVAHEIGHLIMHEGVALARSNGIPHKFYEDSEWQADAFAAELLMPTDGCMGMSAEAIKLRFGVSLPAAQAKFNALNK